MLRQPGGGPDPHRPAVGLRRGTAPGVGLNGVPDTPAAVQVHGRLAGMRHQPLEVLQERLHVALHPGRLGEPVVHLQVDVVVVVAVPRRLQVLVPLALQVRRQRGVGGRGAQQVAPVVEVQQRQAGIRPPLPHAPDPLVGRHLRRLQRQLQPHAAVVALVLAHVGPKQVIPCARIRCARIPCGRFAQSPRGALLGGGPAEGRHADVDGEHRLGDPFTQQFPPVDDAPPPAAAPHAALHPEVHPVADAPVQGQARLARSGCIRVEGELAIGIVGAVEPRYAIERQPCVRHPHQNQVFDQMRDVLAGEAPSPGQIRHRRTGRLQIQLSVVVTDGAAGEKLQVQVPGRLVRVHPLRPAAAAATAAERVPRRARAVRVVARQQQPPHLRQRIAADLVVAPAVDPPPQAFVIQGDAFPPEGAEHHRRQPPGAERQPLQPFSCRGLVP